MIITKTRMAHLDLTKTFFHLYRICSKSNLQLPIARIVLFVYRQQNDKCYLT